jgi:hypothetical protein
MLAEGSAEKQAGAVQVEVVRARSVRRGIFGIAVTRAHAETHADRFIVAERDGGARMRVERRHSGAPSQCHPEQCALAYRLHPSPFHGDRLLP